MNFLRAAHACLSAMANPHVSDKHIWKLQAAYVHELFRHDPVSIDSQRVKDTWQLMKAEYQKGDK